MPARRSGRDEEATYRGHLDEYLAPVHANPRTDDRPLTVSALQRIWRGSRDTWYKYGARDRLDSARRLRDEARGKRRPKRRNPDLDAARKDAEHWQQMYRALLVNWTIVEGYFLNHPSVSLDDVLSRGLRKPDRREPK